MLRRFCSTLSHGELGVDEVDVIGVNAIDVICVDGDGVNNGDWALSTWFG